MKHLPVILIAEDDENLRLLLRHDLERRYEVRVAADGVEALEIIGQENVDLLVADIMMPRMDGFELVQEIRRRNIGIPAMMLTANQTFDAKRTGFRIGIDDYMTKPVNVEELLWRIKAILRRAGATEDEVLQIGAITVDAGKYSVARGDYGTSLPKKEFELLFKLVSSPGRIFTKTQLMEDVWGLDSESGEETIKTHMSRLRSSIADFPEISIVAIKGIGYKAQIDTDAKR